MGNVTVSGVSFSIYGDLSAANDYMLGVVGPGATAWLAATPDVKAKFLVQAFRMLEAMIWQGAQSASPQAQQWPRTSVVDAYGLAVDSSTVPTNVVSAEYELAAQLAGDASVATQTQTGSNVRRVQAKGVGVEFFRPTNIPGVSPILPVPVMRLVGQYLATATATPLSRSFNSNDPDGENTNDGDFGGDLDSAFSDDAIMDRTGPLI